MAKFKKPLLFTVCILPVAVVAIIFTCLYQFDLYPPEVIDEMVAQFGSTALVMVISVIQNVGMILVCCFFGYILAEKIGLWKPIRFGKKEILVALSVSAVAGIIFSLGYWTFGNAADGIKEATEAGMTLYGVISSVLYGGIIEEIMLRLFIMSLVAFIIIKIFYRKREKDEIPTRVFVAANIISALLFAAGHLPATLTTFGELTPILLFRCFLFNGGFGLLFGWLYRKYGLSYAMLGHITVHAVSKIIWFIFI